MAVEFRALREDEREECIALWCTVWPGENNPVYFRKYFYGDVEWLPYYTQVAVEDGKLVSAVHICKRVVACGDFRLTVGCIANVATLPEYRGKGYNTECLKKAIAVMEADAMDFSLLFTGINAYYAKQGYATLPLPSLSGNLRPLIPDNPKGFPVRPAMAADIPAIRAVYAEYNKGRPLAVERSEAYWRDWIGLKSERIPPDLLVGEKNGDIVGYIQAGSFRSAEPYDPAQVERSIIELGTGSALTSDEAYALTRSLLETVLEKFQSQGHTRARFEIAKAPAVRACLAELLEEVEENTGNYGMIRLLHRTNLLKSLTLFLNERWQEAGSPDVPLSLTTPYGPVGLETSGNFLRVTESPSLPRHAQETLFAWLFGLTAPQEEVWSQLLAPAKAGVFWGADGF